MLVVGPAAGCARRGQRFRKRGVLIRVNVGGRIAAVSAVGDEASPGRGVTAAALGRGAGAKTVAVAIVEPAGADVARWPQLPWRSS